MAASLAMPALMPSAGAQSVPSDALLIGSTLAMTGPLGAFGQAIVTSTNATMKEINAKGGVLGRPLVLEHMDDAYIATKSVENVKALMNKPNLIGLLSCLGTPNIAAIMPLVEAANLPLVGPVTGAASLREKDLRNVFHVRASYRDELEQLVTNLVGMNIKDLAVLYMDNPFGKELAADATRSLTKVGVQAKASVALATDGSNLNSAIQQVLASRPSAVLLATAGAASDAAVVALRKVNPFLPIATTSVAFTQAGVKKMGALSQGVAMTVVMPDVNQTKYPVVRAYHAAMLAAGQDPIANASVESYVNTHILAEALTRAGRNPTRAGLRDGLASLRNFDLNGFKVDYGPGSPRVASNFVALGVMSSDGKLRF